MHEVTCFQMALFAQALHGFPIPMSVKVEVLTMGYETWWILAPSYFSILAFCTLSFTHSEEPHGPSCYFANTVGIFHHGNLHLLLFQRRIYPLQGFVPRTSFLNPYLKRILPATWHSIWLAPWLLFLFLPSRTQIPWKQGTCLFHHVEPGTGRSQVPTHIYFHVSKWVCFTLATPVSQNGKYGSFKVTIIKGK